MVRTTHAGLISVNNVKKDFTLFVSYTESNMRFAKQFSTVLLLHVFAALVASSSAESAFDSSHYVCPPSFQKLSTGCYYFSKYLLNFWQAAELCVHKGGFLVVVEDADESDCLKNQIKKLGEANQRYYIGAYDLGHEGKWVWEATRQPMLFTDWHDYQPDNYRGQQNCAMYDPGMKWDDGGCDSKQRFICEASPILLSSSGTCRP